MTSNIDSSIATSPDLSLSYPQPWKHIARSFRTTGFTGSESAVEIAKDWLNDCITSHPNCRDNHDQTLPTRLLDLELLHNTKDLKLVETTGESGQYAALSHCWGTTQQFTTTKATLTKRKVCIPFTELPKTFKEAVQVARALRIRYLWIDSLCIIQGDHDDWAREAARMSAVYQNALITIAAAASDSGDKGLFRRSVEYEVETHPTEGESLSLIFRPPRKHLGSREDREMFPLAQRAWALQERFLSPRVLHYTSQELSFECTQAVSYTHL